MNGYLLIAGMAAVLSGGAAGARFVARRRKDDAKLASRLEALRPSVGALGASRLLLGPEVGPAALRVRFARADAHLSRRTFYVAAGAIVGFALLVGVVKHPAAALAVLALATVGAFMALDVVATRRAAALRRSLPFLLDAIRQNLTVGASLHQALIRAVEQSSLDVRRYFAPVLRRLHNGATVEEGLIWLADRLGLAELDMLSMAVQTNARFGGALSPSLTNLSQILRDQARVKRELKAATAETRLSGWVLAGLPLLAIVGVSFMNPAYASFLTGTATGNTMLAFAFGFQVLGTLVMIRLMRMDF